MNFFSFCHYFLTKWENIQKINLNNHSFKDSSSKGTLVGELKALTSLISLNSAWNLTFNKWAIEEECSVLKKIN